MRKVLILEDRLQSDALGYDHIFSFFSDQAQSFADDYISPSEVQSLYVTVYDSICERLGKPEHEKTFSYKGVNLLSCLKKELFYFVYWIALKAEILRRVMQRFQDAAFYMPGPTDDFSFYRAADILKRGAVKPLPPLCWVDLPFQKKPEADDSLRAFPRASFWPKFLSFGKLNRCQTAIFSDYARSKSLLKFLSSKGCALFTNAPSPLTVLRAFRDGLSLAQIAYAGQEDKKSSEKIAQLLQQLKRTRMFAGVTWGDLNGEPFLQWRLEQVFRTCFQKLFFEIDGMHRFFRQAPSLRSALLDEDIGPSKNAFCQIAKQYSIRTFVELHGALGGKHGVMPLTADRMFVWGQAQKDKLIRWGCPGDKLIVSGCSRYGEYQKMKKEQVRARVAKDLGLDANNIIVLLVFSPCTLWNWWYEHRMKRVISEALQVAQKLAGESQVQFVIKLHPADIDEQYYRDWIEKNQLRGRAVVIKKYDPLLLAKAVDFLVVYGSTYAVDGFALDKPVICLEDLWEPLLEEYRKYAVFLYANSKQEFYDHAKKLLGSGIPCSHSWAQAKKEVLNQNDEDPVTFIASQLTHV